MAEDETVVVTMRTTDVKNPVPGSCTRPCDDCGELTLVSSFWENKKIDRIICKPCWREKYKDGEYTALIHKETIQEVLNALKNRGKYVTEEKLIRNLEKEVGRKINIV